MKTIYLAHEYGGLKENVCKACDLGNKLTLENSDIHIFNAVLYFEQFKEVLLEDEIMKRCLDMVSRCDEIWMSPGWTDSKGCNLEYEMARKLEKPVVYLLSDRHARVEG